MVSSTNRVLTPAEKDLENTHLIYKFSIETTVANKTFALSRLGRKWYEKCR